MRDKQPQCQPIGIDHDLCRPITEKRGRSCPTSVDAMPYMNQSPYTAPFALSGREKIKQRIFAAQKFITIKTVPKLQDI